MTAYSAYIGDLDDPAFRWNSGNPSGNIPLRLSPIFPAITFEHWSDISLKIKNSLLIGKKTDWGAFVVIGTSHIFLKIIYEWYGVNGVHLKDTCPHLMEDYYAVVEFVKNLQVDHLYGLVVMEDC